MWYKFQYISCYGLSLKSVFDDHLRDLFQYISCYGLSTIRYTCRREARKFQYISCYGLSSFFSMGSMGNRYFNTSHVTVYRIFRWGIWSAAAISIHLMLRFIGEEYKLPENIKEFQYISCYGLSCNQVDSFIAEYHFNTSHVTVYLLTFCALFGRIPISIHLMLRFIVSEIK